MKVYRTEEEQLSEIRQFFQKYGKVVILSVVLSFAVVWGWRYWQSQQKNTQAEASTIYQQLIDELARPTLGDNVEAAQQAMNFAKENKTVYGVLTAMKLAQYYADKAEYSHAQQALDIAVSNTNDVELLATINIRLAKLMFQQGQLEQALNQLDKVKLSTWLAQVNELRGDILTADKRYTAAYDAYVAALSAEPKDQQQQANLNIKLNQAEYLKAKQIAEETQKIEQATPQTETEAAQTAG